MRCSDENTWVAVNRHLQKYGIASCDVSNMLLMADEERANGNARAAHALAWAARDVLHNRRLARRRSLAHKPKRKTPL